MGDDPLEAGQEIRIPSGERDVAIGAVSAGDTWSFSAAGKWSTGFVRCGPDGYRNFLFDALEFAPRVPGAARLKLMGKFQDEPDSAAFPIGAGCTQTFARSGELVVFANDQAGGLWRQSRRGDPHSRSRRRRGGAGRGRWRQRRVDSLPRRVQPHQGHTGHRRIRARRLLDPGFHAAGPGPGARASARMISFNIRPACCRSLLRSRCSSSRSRPGAGRESLSIRTMAPIAPIGGQDNC